MIVAERRRSARRPFFASAEITEPATRYCVRARTNELSRGGCYIDMLNPLLRETALEVRIIHEGETMEISARVVHSQPNIGMGLRFEVADSPLAGVLDQWLAGVDA